MGIFERMSRVASANFNALLDRADSPEKSLELTLHEMREQLRAARREVVRSVAAEKQLGNKAEELGGDVVFESPPGGGTRVIARLPLARARPA